MAEEDIYFPPMDPRGGRLRATWTKGSNKTLNKNKYTSWTLLLCL